MNYKFLNFIKKKIGPFYQNNIMILVGNLIQVGYTKTEKKHLALKKKLKKESCAMVGKKNE